MPLIKPNVTLMGVIDHANLCSNLSLNFCLYTEQDLTNLVFDYILLGFEENAIATIKSNLINAHLIPPSSILNISFMFKMLKLKNTPLKVNQLCTLQNNGRDYFRFVNKFTWHQSQISRHKFL